jgi:hypothetical protein
MLLRREGMAEVEKNVKRSPKRMLTVGDLIATHNLYDENVEEWSMLQAVYDGIRSIIMNGYIKQHEREPDSSFKRRKDELFGLGYSKSIVEIFHFYLFKKPPKRQIGSLKNERVWDLFSNDSDLYGNNMDSVLMESSLYSAIQGHMGILVDKASTFFNNKLEQYEAKVYPYMAKYFPAAILDWVYERDDNSRPRLAMLKLLDDLGGTEQYRIWHLDSWEIWELPKDQNGNPDKSNTEAEGIFINSGENPIGEIPFIWQYNLKSKNIGVGVSDIHEVSRIDLSIIRNLSQIEEIINFAAFPIMRKPMRDISPTDVNNPQQDDEVSVQAIIEYDPESPESKPDWLPSEAAGPIQATLDFIAKKIQEIYRSSNAGGMAATEIQTQAKSGVALKTEFQLLNAKLAGKAMNLDAVEMKAVEYFLKWEDLWEKYKEDYIVERDRTYDVENLAVDLENALTAKTVVISNTFDELLQKQTARQVLPTASEEDLSSIDAEIESAVKQQPPSSAVPDNGDAMDDDEGFIEAGSSPAANATAAQDGE